MAVSTLPEAPASRPAVLNLPNTLTLSRLAMATVLFALLAMKYYSVSFVLFVVAASTDWLDGYLARKRGETTTLGRILDPFVDKVVVIGTFVFLLPVPESRLAPWMITLVIARELLVTGLRSYLEGESVAFGADWAGKVKMTVQCVTIACILLVLGATQGVLASTLGGLVDAWAYWMQVVLIWGMVGVTALSGVSYVWRAASLLRDR